MGYEGPSPMPIDRFGLFLFSFGILRLLSLKKKKRFCVFTRQVYDDDMIGRAWMGKAILHGWMDEEESDRRPRDVFVHDDQSPILFPVQRGKKNKKGLLLLLKHSRQRIDFILRGRRMCL